MLPRERVERALDFKSVDIPALECDVNPVGIYEHGEKLRTLIGSLDSDFGPVSQEQFAMPDETHFDSDGRYHHIFTDEWGVTWEQRIFGVMGHPLKRPLDDWDNLDTYQLPPYGSWGKDSTTVHRKQIQAIKDAGYFTKRGWIKFMELTYAVRRFEDVLMDVHTRDENLIRFTDKLMDFYRVNVENLLSLDVDCIQFADDLGTQTAPLISPQSFRDVYKPYFKELVSMVKKAGKRAFFHTCGYSLPFLEDLKEIGIDCVWPQLNTYDLNTLADCCRDLQLAACIHPERSGLMTHGTPEDVRREILRYHDIFRPQDGGFYYYLEIDNGFPYENIVAMAETIRLLRQ